MTKHNMTEIDELIKAHVKSYQDSAGDFLIQELWSMEGDVKRLAYAIADVVTALMVRKEINCNDDEFDEKFRYLDCCGAGEQDGYNQRITEESRIREEMLKSLL